MLKERFMFYIHRGYFEGEYYTRCPDKSEPKDLGWMSVPYRLYFAKNHQGGIIRALLFNPAKRDPIRIIMLY